MSKSVKQPRALILRATRSDDGMVRVSLDDAIQTGKDEWRFDVHVTSNDFESEDFKSLAIDEKVLAGFGYYILARLKSYKNHLDD